MGLILKLKKVFYQFINFTNKQGKKSLHDQNVNVFTLGETTSGIKFNSIKLKNFYYSQGEFI